MEQILLTDKEADAVYLQVSGSFVEGDLTRAHERAQHKAQLKKVVNEKEGLGKFAKAYDMLIDGFVVPWDFWQALLKEVEE